MAYKMHFRCPTSSFLLAKKKNLWIKPHSSDWYICHTFISCRQWPCHRKGALAHSMSMVLFPPVGKCDTSQVDHQYSLLIVSRTAAKSVNVCQINLTWKLCGDYSCEYVHIPQLLAQVSNTQVVGIWFILCSPN